ncbi:hypothetical protein [Salmonella sp. s51228]|uniref:hypothetical protein n=1 Tax=Salmonella sp. s51228 TaxID=3159652 RepID=UPI00397F2CCC
MSEQNTQATSGKVEEKSQAGVSSVPANIVTETDDAPSIKPRSANKFTPSSSHRAEKKYEEKPKH